MPRWWNSCILHSYSTIFRNTIYSILFKVWTIHFLTIVTTILLFCYPFTDANALLQIQFPKENIYELWATQIGSQFCRTATDVNAMTCFHRLHNVDQKLLSVTYISKISIFKIQEMSFQREDMLFLASTNNLSPRAVDWSILNRINWLMIPFCVILA